MVKMILILVMTIFLAGWMIFCAIQFIRRARTIVATGDFTGHVKCEKCGTVYDVSPEKFTESCVVKSKTVTKTKRRGPALVNRPEYRYFAKKFHCPGCGRRAYGQVININEINDIMLVPSIKAGIRWLIIMAVGALLIITVMSIPMYFADRYTEQQIEKLKQQRYEEFSEKYGLYSMKKEWGTNVHMHNL